MKNTQMKHRHGGNGWIIVQELGDDCVKVVNCGINDIGDQVFMAWEKCLEEETVTKGKITLVVPIPARAQPAVDALREALKSGTKRIVDTRIVAA